MRFSRKFVFALQGRLWRYETFTTIYLLRQSKCGQLTVFITTAKPPISNLSHMFSFHNSTTIITFLLFIFVLDCFSLFFTLCHIIKHFSRTVCGPRWKRTRKCRYHWVSGVFGSGGTSSQNRMTPRLSSSRVERTSNHCLSCFQALTLQRRNIKPNFIAQSSVDLEYISLGNHSSSLGRYAALNTRHRSSVGWQGWDGLFLQFHSWDYSIMTISTKRKYPQTSILVLVCGYFVI